jgi:hypothetical protein
MAKVVQTNIRPAGRFEILAGEDLTDKEGHLCVITHDTNVPEVKLPADVHDEAMYLIIEGAADGEHVTVEAIQPGHRYRARNTGTCVPGDRLALGAIDGTDDGKIRDLPAAADTYFSPGIAEEAGVDEGAVQFLCAPKEIVVT